MFKKKFDRVNGEIRQCRECNIDFHSFKPVCVCRPCDNRIKRERLKERSLLGEIDVYRPKKPYPFSNKTAEANNRFARIRAKNNQAWKLGREAINQHYERQLKEIEENGILEWIYDRRDDETIRSKRSKSKSYISKNYPDTRGHYEY
jgi:hypothetical protein